jgi:hypothetical protein
VARGAEAIRILVTQVPQVFERVLEGKNGASLRQQWMVMPSMGYGTPDPYSVFGKVHSSLASLL